jgi:SAM-dependent methyltransferase
MTTGDDERSTWETRYGADDYQPEPAPTPFLVEATARLVPGAALCLAAGAGRNAVHLAAAGWQVTAADISSRGLQWCRRLAQDRGVDVVTVATDLRTWDLGRDRWDLITMVSYLDVGRFADIRRALLPGGHFLLHTFGRGQTELGWGPSSPDHLAQPDQVWAAFEGFDLVHFEDGVFPRPDGRREAVVRMLARRSEP